MKKKRNISKPNSKKLKLNKIVISKFDTTKVKGGGNSDGCGGGKNRGELNDGGYANGGG